MQGHVKEIRAPMLIPAPYMLEKRGEGVGEGRVIRDLLTIQKFIDFLVAPCKPIWVCKRPFSSSSPFFSHFHFLETRWGSLQTPLKSRGLTGLYTALYICISSIYTIKKRIQVYNNQTLQ